MQTIMKSYILHSFILISKIENLQTENITAMSILKMQKQCQTDIQVTTSHGSCQITSTIQEFLCVGRHMSSSGTRLPETVQIGEGPKTMKQEINVFRECKSNQFQPHCTCMWLLRKISVLFTSHFKPQQEARLDIPLHNRAN